MNKFCDSHGFMDLPRMQVAPEYGDIPSYQPYYLWGDKDIPPLYKEMWGPGLFLYIVNRTHENAHLLVNRYQ